MAVEQGTATFQRQHSLADDIDWLLNGTSLNRAGLPNTSSSVQFKDNVSNFALLAYCVQVRLPSMSVSYFTSLSLTAKLLLNRPTPVGKVYVCDCEN